MKKILIVIILTMLSSCSGYERMFAHNGNNFQINEIKFINNSDTNKDIARYLRPYEKNLTDNKINKIKLEIESDYNENVISRNSKGDPTMYEMVVSAKIILSHNQTKKELFLIEKLDYAHQSSQFELNSYKKNLRENLIRKIFNNIVLELRNL